MKATPAPISDSQFQEIRDLAYLLWRQAGCPAGKDLHFWLEAEQQIVEGRQAPEGAKAVASRQPTPSASAAKRGRRSASAQPHDARSP